MHLLLLQLPYNLQFHLHPWSPKDHWFIQMSLIYLRLQWVMVLMNPCISLFRSNHQWKNLFQLLKQQKWVNHWNLDNWILFQLIWIWGRKFLGEQHSLLHSLELQFLIIAIQQPSFQFYCMNNRCNSTLLQYHWNHFFQLHQVGLEHCK